MQSKRARAHFRYFYFADLLFFPDLLLARVGLGEGITSVLWGRLGFKNREGASDGDVLEKMLVKMKAYQMVMNEEWGICYFRAILARFKQTRESY
jgi:hypothetical protein